MEKRHMTASTNVGAFRKAVFPTSDGSLTGPFKAVASSDLEMGHGTIHFEDGEIQRITGKSDGVKEPVEDFVVAMFDDHDPSINSSTSITIINSLSGSPGVFEFRESQMTVRESLRKAILTIKRTGGTDGPVSLRLRTVDGTALQTQDYKPISKVIHFNAGEQEKTCEIDIIDDNIPEGLKQFRVGLFDPTNGAILGPNSIVNVIIMDDDTLTARPVVPRSGETRFFLKDTTLVVARGSPVVTFVIRREGGSLEPATVFMESFDNTAKANIDYKNVRGDVTFDKNEVEVALRIKLIDIPEHHGFNSFQVRISNPSTGSVVLGKDILTIFIENESKPHAGQGFGTHGSISASFGPNIRSDSQIVTTHTKSKNIMTGGFDSNLKVDSNMRFLTDQRVASSGGVLTSGSRALSTLGSLTSGLFSSESGSISAGFSGSRPISSEISGSSSRSSGQTITSTGFQTQGTSPITCAPGLIFRSCSSTCPKYCNLEADPTSCNKGCISGCFCPDGLLIESFDSPRCLHPSQCPGGERTAGISLGSGGSGGSLLGGLLG
ncbi:g-protein coupled receptor 98 [Trichonephila clavata]|uniref:G-protein coupled receptor 98 n=1 Tax=Trichonephila clavata TaxID=2740835 RepID=A0A8X6L9N3_TRICU|nr:g-protein coupled receptor 98 [Trichonephila clavata]